MDEENQLMPFDSVPDFLVAADNHAVAADEPSMIDNVANFTKGTVYSVVNNFYNTGVAINNFLGGDAEEVDLQNYMDEADSNLGNYYRQHKELVDVAGFIVGSFAPGMAALKGYKAIAPAGRALSGLEAGFVGENMSAATGLLAPTQKKLLAAAVQEITSSTGTFKLLNRNMIGAIAAGVGEQAIQSAVMETAVAATMFKSPILEDMDVADLGSNVLWGTLFGGAVGGALETAVMSGIAKRAKVAADADLMPFTHINEVRPGSTVDERLLVALDDKFSTPTAADVPELVAKYGESTLLHKRDAKIASINNQVNTLVRESANGDDLIGNMLADEVLAFTDTNKAADTLLGMRNIYRISDDTPGDKKIAQLAKKIAEGSATEEDLAAFKAHTNTYYQFWGEQAGDIFHDAPVYSGIQDSLKAGQELKVTDHYVQVGSSNRYNFKHNNKSMWDIMTASQEETEARYLWAYKSNKIDFKIPVANSDIPLLERGLQDLTSGATPSVTVKVSGGSKVFTSAQHLEGFLFEQKKLLQERFRTAADDMQIISDPKIAAQKIKELTGVHFQLSNKSKDALAWTYQGTSGAREQIYLNPDYISSTPLARLVQAIKHEEGHNAWNLASDIGMVSTQDRSIVLAEAEKVSRKMRPENWKTADRTKDFNYVRDPHELMADTFAYASMHSRKEVEKEIPKFAELLYAHVNPMPQEVIDALNIKARNLTTPEIAKRLNMRASYLDETKVSENIADDMLANQSFIKQYNSRMEAAGFKPNVTDPYALLTKPQHAKVTYDTSIYDRVDGNVLAGMAEIKQRQRLYKNSNDFIVASILGADSRQLFNIEEDKILKANSFGAGAGKTSFAEGAYGSLESYVNRIGAVTRKLYTDRINSVTDTLTPSLFNIRSNQAATLELSSILNKIRATPEKYVLGEDGTSLVLRGNAKVEADRAAGKKVSNYIKQDATAEDIIHIENEHVAKFVADHISTNGRRVTALSLIKNQHGIGSDFDPDIFYAPPVNPDDYPFFAFVVDDKKITSTGRVKMIYAATEAELKALADKVPKDYTVRFKTDTEAYHMARGDFDRDAAIFDTTMDSALHKSGVSAQFFPVTDGVKLVDDIMKWHTGAEKRLVRETVLLKYAKETAELRRLGESFTRVATSKYGRYSLLKTAEETVKNPYIDYIKTMLDLSKTTDAKLWTDINTAADKFISDKWNTLTGAFVKTKSVEELDAINAAFKEAGIKTAYYDAATDLLANHTAPRHVLISFVQRANAIMASVTLRVDALNAINNTVGSVVLTGTELRSLLKQIEIGNPEAAGELAQLAKIKIPGTDKEMLSTTKLVTKAISNFSDKRLLETYRRDGFISRHLIEYQSIADDLALTGSESVADLNGALRNAHNKAMKFFDIGEKYTGNKTAEEFTRFVAANIMDQITGIAIKHGVLDKDTARSYIQTFVNRTQGNYLASQRPLMFSGPIGQAVGLFQTYQFTLLQQLFRHVADGQAKNAAFLLGLQGTIYGMNGLPAFQVLNTHLIGNAAGNTSHADLYSVAYSGDNKTAADWITYGAASNVLGLINPNLKVNLYARGDINPRHLTVIPTAPADIPIVNATSKFFGNLFNTSDKAVSGGDLSNVFLQGLEHNGVNRPLAGMAAALEALGNDQYKSYTTTGSGNLSSTNDLLSLVNLGRILGGKPMDEAIAIDAGFRRTVYQAKDAARRKELGSIIKSTLVSGDYPSSEQLNSFMHQYVKAGGKQQNFNKYMTSLYKSANTPQANIIQQNLSSPYGKRMQQLMGGASFSDFNDVSE